MPPYNVRESMSENSELKKYSPLSLLLVEQAALVQILHR